MPTSPGGDGRSAAERWRSALEAWAIPRSILEQAPEDPYGHPVEPFRFVEGGPLTPSHRAALEALPEGGTVVDVGAGGGAMSRPLRPRAGRIVAVDRQETMLAECGADELVLGTWPQAAASVDPGDVVVCGHVLYNAPDLEPFLAALTAATRRRVVVEMTATHPLAGADQRALWRRFWGVERPVGPTWADAVAVLGEMGIQPAVERWESPPRFGFRHLDDLVAAGRRRLCLPAERDPEVREAVLEWAVERDGRWLPRSSPTAIVALWWDPEEARRG